MRLRRDSFAAYQGRWDGVEGQAAYLQKIAHFDEHSTRELEPLLSTIGVPVHIVQGRSVAARPYRA